MNLTTHWVLAFALGIGLFHNFQIALVMSIGALIPDLDREYLFVAKGFIGRHQLHRALFHNIFVVGLLCLVNPFLSLGAVTHSLLDMFTSATDRGSELLFPLTRIVENYHYRIDGEKIDHPRKMEWWVEDPWRLLKQTSDRDLQEPQEQSWRRLYGPFKNSRVVDWGVFFGSIVFLLTAFAFMGNSLYSLTGFEPLALISLVGISIFYGLGEWWRRKLISTKDKETNWVVLGILIIGLVTFFLGTQYLVRPPSLPDLQLFALATVSMAVGLIAAYAFVRLRKSDDLSL
jgi:hypothetical protein